jgi:HEAT repeat protein
MPLLGLFGPSNVEKLKAKGDVQGLIKALSHKKDVQIDWQKASVEAKAKYKGYAAVRQAAAEALGQIRDARAVEPLVAALKDKMASVREAAIKALVKIGTPSVMSLVAALKDEEWTARMVAAEALGQIGDARAVEPLVAALKDETGNVQVAVKEALGQIDPNWMKSAAVKEAIPAFVAALKNKNINVRLGAAEMLGKLGDARAVDPLVTVLKDKKYKEFDNKKYLRRKAAEALGEIGDARAMEPLAEALTDEDSEVKRAAAEALVRIGPAAVELLITVLKERSEWYAAWALGQIGDARAVEPLVATVVNAKNLRELATPMPVEEPILALEKVLERVAAEVTTEELRKIVTLGDSIHVSSPTEVCMYWSKTIDCSHVKQLARQELIRRGLEV